MAPISRTETGFSPAAYGATPPNVPGVPAFAENEQFSIETGVNDVLKMSYDGGATTDVTLSQGIYTYATLATELKTQIDSALSCTSAVTYESVSEANETKYTITVTGHTIALTYTGSTAADTLGFDSDKSAAESITSDNYIHGLNTITFTFAANGNPDEIEYAIYDNTTGKYVGTDGKSDEASEVWQTRANWNGGGAAGKVTVIGLTDYTAYTFKVKAKNELDVESEFCSDSASMNTLPQLDWGEQSDELEREITTGNTKVKSDTSSGTETEITVSGTYGDITLTYTLINNDSTTSRIAVEYSEDGTNWAAATEGTGGDGTTGLTTSPTGVQHTYVWDSYTDAGASEKKENTCYLRITPYDASPTGGDAGATRTSPAFTVNNRPVKITLLNADGYTFDKDTTPVFEAVMGSIRGGSKLYHRIKIWDKDDNLELNKSSAIDQTGWEYEDSPGSWNSVGVNGVDPAHVDGTNKIRYTVQASDALDADNDDPYKIKIEQGEVRARG